MAPKRGGGGGGSRGGSSSSSCPGAFSSTTSQVYFAQTVVFFAVTLGIFIALCSVRKKSGAGKKLLGLPYVFALFLFLLGYALDLIKDVLRQCGTIGTSDYYSMAIAADVFWGLAYWVLLFVIIYTLNTMLRDHLGNPTAVFKVVYIAILGLIFALTCGSTGLTSYNIWTRTIAGFDDDAEPLFDAAQKLRLAYCVLYFISVVVSGALSLMTIFAMRSRRLPGGDLLGWVIALIFSMVCWTVIPIVFAATYIRYDVLEFATIAALSYIQSFFQALSFILLLCIAKHAAWSQSAVATTTLQAYAPVAAQQPVYAYNNTNGQQYYYQQAPVYNNGQGGSLAYVK